MHTTSALYSYNSYPRNQVCCCQISQSMSSPNSISGIRKIKRKQLQINVTVFVAEYCEYHAV